MLALLSRIVGTFFGLSADPDANDESTGRGVMAFFGLVAVDAFLGLLAPDTAASC